MNRNELQSLKAYPRKSSSVPRKEPKHSRKRPKVGQGFVDYVHMKIEVPLNDEEWSLLNAAADSIASSPEELARVSLMQRCMVMSEDNDVCSRTREMIGLSFVQN